MSIIERPAEVELPVVSDEDEQYRDVFLRAAEIIERDGWGIGPHSMCQDSKKCILGAIGKALDAPLVGEFFEGYLMYSYSDIQDFLKDRGDHQDMFAWNDNISPYRDRGQGARDKDDVLHVLQQMANGKTFNEAARVPTVREILCARRTA